MVIDCSLKIVTYQTPAAEGEASTREISGKGRRAYGHYPCSSSPDCSKRGST